jgi:hypothetical protein
MGKRNQQKQFTYPSFLDEREQKSIIFIFQWDNFSDETNLVQNVRMNSEVCFWTNSFRTSKVTLNLDCRFRLDGIKSFRSSSRAAIEIKWNTKRSSQRRDLESVNVLFFFFYCRYSRHSTTL